MKKLLLIVFLSFIWFAAFLSCKKHLSAAEDEVFGIIPDMSAKVTASVEGFVTDERDSAVVGAMVNAGALSAVTNGYGYFQIDSAEFSKVAGFVRINKPGYYTGTKTFTAVAGGSSMVRAKLISRVVNGAVDASTGGSVSISTGATVKLPPNGIALASNSSMYTGQVNVSVHWLDPLAPSTESAMPGNLSAISFGGYLEVLRTFGMMVVELTGDAGERLQLAPGKKAVLDFPISASMSGDAPASIPMWFFNEETGLWQEEGSAQKTGNFYKAEVAHFSYWNCDISQSAVNFTARIVDVNMNPLTIIPVTITIAGAQGSSRTSYTDHDGNVSGIVAGNASLTIDIKTVCNVLIDSRTINTTTTDVDMGNVEISVPQFQTIFKGTVTKCNSSPVNDGYVMITAEGYNVTIPVVGGIFEATVLACQSNTRIVAIDKENNMESLPRNIAITPGVQNIANLSVCPASNIPQITYTFDGVSHVLDLSNSHFLGQFYPSEDRDYILAYHGVGQACRYLVFWYGHPEGVYYTVSPIVRLENRYYSLQNSPPVNMTSFPYVIGGFYTASLSGGILKDTLTQTLHTFSTTINVKRTH